MRKAAVLLLISLLTACHRDTQNKEAVRQAIVNALKARGDLNLEAMDVNVDSVEFHGDQADASVSFAAKGSSQPMMRMPYHLERKDDRWVVVSRGSTGHGTAPPPETPNPHGGSGSRMPSPESLPPAGKRQ